MKTLQTITLKSFSKQILFNKTFLKVGFILSVVIFSLLSYGRAFDYYFWRDDTKVVWMEKHVPAQINNFSTLGTARARIGSVFFDFVEYTTLGFNSLPHQVFGYLIRFINIVLVYFFAKKMFGSKKVAIVSCLFAASFIGGLEAYSWVRGIGVMITLGLISFITYIHSYETKSIRWYLLSVACASLSLSMDIWRTMGIIIVISLWEGLHLFVKRQKDEKPVISRKISIARIFGFLFIQFSILKLVLLGSSSAGGSVTSSANGYVTMALQGVTWGHFVTSLGNLIRIPFLYVQEKGGLTDAGMLSTVFGIVLLAVLIVVTVKFILKREAKLIPWIVLLVWIPLFYGPNWLYSQTLEVASTHRYLAFSSIVVPILWAQIAVTKLPSRLGFIFICIFVFLGLTHAQAVVERDYGIRGRDFVLPIWQNISNSTPIGETNQLLSVTGDNRVVGYVFAWSDVFPFATFKNIGSPRYLPLYADVKIASRVLCDSEATIPDPLSGNFTKAGNNFSISKSYAWYIKDSNTIKEVTDEFRNNIAEGTPCLWKQGTLSMLPTAHIIKYSVIPLKQTPNTYSFLTSWQNTDAQNGVVNYVASITDEANIVPLDIKIGKVIFTKSKEPSYSHVVFEFEKKPKTKYLIKLFACKSDCTNSHTQNVLSLNFNELLSISTHESQE